MTYSDTARAKGISNVPTPAHKAELAHTCVYMLEPFRKLLNEHYKCPVSVKITSGYRSLALNNAIPGASKTSAHSRGCAADVWVYKTVNGKKVQVPPSEVYGLVKQWVKAGKLTVDQLIDEKSGNTTWTHLGFAPQIKDCRKQFLIYRNGRYTADK